MPDLQHFTDADLAVLSKTLKLPKTTFNYANPNWPEHYLNEDIEFHDNTPEHNQMTNMGATLGRVLFYDKNLSIDNTISCASCHRQSAAFADTEKFSEGIKGQRTKRNSMGLINARYYENERFFWDERAPNLEEQVLMPIQDHVEMGMNLEDLEVKLAKLDYYPVLFRNAFGTENVTSDRISRALAQFIRSIISFDSKWDEGLRLTNTIDDDEDIDDFPNFTEQENLGMDIFVGGRKGATCKYCHGTPQNVNDDAKNNGLSLNYKDKGKGAITGNPQHNATFKVPSLRNIANTAPYMHDGRFSTLMEVVNHYSEGVQPHKNLNFRLSTIDDDDHIGGPAMKLNLNQEEKEALVAFLHTLTDEKILTDEKYSDPFK